MSLAVRRVVGLTCAAGLGGMAAWGFAGLPAFGDYQGVYGRMLDSGAVAARHATNVVAAVTFDYRGTDTLLEEVILFTAVVAVALLLRAQRGEVERSPHDQAADRTARRMSDAVRVFGLVSIGPTVVLGLYIVAHGHLTPGGGFQGGVLLASALMLVYLAGEFLDLARVGPVEMLDAFEGLGAGGFAAGGLSGLVLGGAFLYNYLPYGTVGELDSGGLIALLNLTVSLAVAAGFSVILSEFLEQTVVVRRPRP